MSSPQSGLLRLLTRFGSFFGAREPKAFSGFTPQKEFRESLRRECERVDRNDHVMSLVMFEPSDESATSIAPLAEALLYQARATDEVGWLGKRQMGAILFGTPADGASIFADKIRREVAASSAPPKFTVFSYPDTSPPQVS